MGTTIEQQTNIDTALNNLGNVLKQQIGLEEAKHHLYVLMLDFYDLALMYPSEMGHLHREMYTLRLFYEAISGAGQSIE